MTVLYSLLVRRPDGTVFVTARGDARLRGIAALSYLDEGATVRYLTDDQAADEVRQIEAAKAAKIVPDGVHMFAIGDRSRLERKTA